MLRFARDRRPPRPRPDGRTLRPSTGTMRTASRRPSRAAAARGDRTARGSSPSDADARPRRRSSAPAPGASSSTLRRLRTGRTAATVTGEPAPARRAPRGTSQVASVTSGVSGGVSGRRSARPARTLRHAGRVRTQLTADGGSGSGRAADGVGRLAEMSCRRADALLNLRRIATLFHQWWSAARARPRCVDDFGTAQRARPSTRVPRPPHPSVRALSSPRAVPMASTRPGNYWRRERRAGARRRQARGCVVPAAATSGRAAHRALESWSHSDTTSQRSLTAAYLGTASASGRVLRRRRGAVRRQPPCRPVPTVRLAAAGASPAPPAPRSTTRSRTPPR